MSHTLRYDAGASAYDRLTGRWSRLYIAAVLKAAGIATGFHVLDVATGTGDAAILTADLVGPNGRVLAVDISGPMLREAGAKALGRRIEFLEADAQRLPFADASFDAVLCLFGLMFLPDKGSSLAALRRMLRPRGRLVATCWDTPSRVLFAGLVAEALSEQLPADREDLLRPFSLCDAPTNVALFEAAGFSDVRVNLEERHSQFTSFSDDFWEPIEAGGGRLGQAYLGLPTEARDKVRQEVFKRLSLRSPTEPFMLKHSAWVIVGSR